MIIELLSDAMIAGRHRESGDVVDVEVVLALVLLENGKARAVQSEMETAAIEAPERAVKRRKKR